MKCKYCNKEEFKNPKSYGAHLRNCKLNPNLKIIEQKISNALAIEKITKIFNCPKCNKEFSVTDRPRQFILGKTKKYCSRHCANSKTYTEQRRIKTSKSIKEHIKNIGLFGCLTHKNLTQEQIIDKHCIICNNVFSIKRNKKSQTCSIKCRSIHLSSTLKGKTGGPRRGGGYGKHSNYIKKDGSVIHCQSNMEYDMCRILDLLNLDWSKNYIGFTYVTKTGVNRKYYPDFFIKTYNVYLETKGYLTEDMIYKMNNANINNLIIIKTKKYGGDWEDIQKDPNLLKTHFNQFMRK